MQQLGDLLEEKLESLARFRERLAAYRSQLAEEELISRNIKPTQRRTPGWPRGSQQRLQTARERRDTPGGSGGTHESL